MKKLLLILLLPFSVLAQTNLVLNPSFEDKVQCPISFSNINDAVGWTSATAATPEYCHSCSFNSSTTVPNNSSGYQKPRTGDAYAAIWTYLQSTQIKEYILGKLLSPLVAGQCYNVSFFFSPSGGGGAEAVHTNVGLQFSNDSLVAPHNTELAYIPGYTIEDTNCIDTVNYIDWIEVSGIYIANGGEEFITIGVFHPNDSSSFLNPGAYFGYYYIEDVSVSVTVAVAECVFTYNCLEYSCVVTQDSVGAYGTLDSCLASCYAPSYNCLANACVDPLDGTGLYDSLATCQAACNTTAIEENKTKKQLLKITDVLGRKSKPAPNVPLFYKYSDGTVERKIVIE
jgi:hypothetical protein